MNDSTMNRKRCDEYITRAIVEPVPRLTRDQNTSVVASDLAALSHPPDHRTLLIPA